MARPRDPNNPFKVLAYQYTIAEAVEAFILERYVGNESSSPALELECTRLSREEAVVPEEAFILFLEQIKAHRSTVEKELTRYEFVRRNDAQGITFSPQLGNILHPGRAEDVSTQQGSAKAPSEERPPEKRRRKGRGGKH